jgi:hypothetical protein
MIKKEGRSKGRTMAPANKGNPTNELLLAASALRNRSCIAGDSFPSLT